MVIVVIVPIDDEDFFVAEDGLRIFRGDRGVAVEAKPLFLPGIIGVVTRVLPIM